MAEYIGKEQLIERGHAIIDVGTGTGTAGVTVTEIRETPAAYVVEVVRCRDCKHWKKQLDFSGKEVVIEGRLQGECECLPIPDHTDDYLLTEDDFFCVRGERKKDG